MTDCKKLFAVAVTAIFLITGIACVSTAIDDGSSADESAGYYSIVLKSTLYFTDSDNIASSVNTINTKAGATVCEYADGCLSFTKNIEIQGNQKDGLFILGNTVGKIFVNENMTMKMNYYNRADGTGAIIKNEGDLTFSGSGDTIINSGRNAVICDNNVHFEGNAKIYSDLNGVTCSSIYFDEGSEVYIYAKTNGVLVLGPDICFKKCTTVISGKEYGFNDLYASEISLEGCSIKITSNITAFSKCPSTRHSSMCIIYGSDSSTSTSDMNEIKIGSIANYKNIVTIRQDSINSSTNAVYVILPAVITIVLAFIFILFMMNRYKYGYKTVKDKNGRTKLVRAEGPKNDADVQRNNDRPYESKVQDPKADEPIRTSSDDGRVEVITQSLVEGTSFMLMIDNKVVGYIGPQKAFIDVTPGMCNIVVITNDTDRKTIYQTNQIIRAGMSITVRKRVGGYKVEIR